MKPSSVSYLKDILTTENSIFLGLTETWLSPTHNEAEIKIDGYTPYRKDSNRAKVKKGRYR